MHFLSTSGDLKHARKIDLQLKWKHSREVCKQQITCGKKLKYGFFLRVLYKKVRLPLFNEGSHMERGETLEAYRLLPPTMLILFMMARQPRLASDLSVF